ncbi:MAG: hypothetical protein U9P71_02670 [Campylobacterota bacterium]|nr:hypothetical protein [Campylobacterota bacterium]
MKKIIGLSSAAVLLFTGCANEMAGMAASGLQSGIMPSAMTKSSLANTANTNLATGQYVIKGQNCIPRLTGASVGFMDMAKEKLLSYAIESAMASIIDMKDIQMPAKITNTCEADMRLKYVETISNRYFANLGTVNEKILEAMEQTEEVKKLRAEIADIKAVGDKAALNEGIVEQTDKIVAMAETAKIVDSEKVSEAWGIVFQSAPKYTALLIGWDKEIADFAKDNLPWAIKNFGGLKSLLVQMETVALLATNGKDAFTKLATSNNIEIDEKVAAAAAKEMQKGDQQVLDESKQEFENAFA